MGPVGVIVVWQDSAIGQLFVELLRSDQCGLTSLDTSNNAMLAGVLMKYNKSITDVDLSGTVVDTQAVCLLAIEFNHNVSITSLDLSNSPLCTLDQPVYNLKGEDFKGVYALAQVLSCSPLSLNDY